MNVFRGMIAEGISDAPGEDEGLGDVLRVRHLPEAEDIHAVQVLEALLEPFHLGATELKIRNQDGVCVRCNADVTLFYM